MTSSFCVRSNFKKYIKCLLTIIYNANLSVRKKLIFTKKERGREYSLIRAIQVFNFSNNFAKTLKNKIFENTFVFVTGKMP